MSLVIHPDKSITDFRSWTESNPPVSTTHKCLQAGLIAGCAAAGIATSIIGYFGLLANTDDMSDPRAPIGITMGVAGNVMLVYSVWATWSAVMGFHAPFPRPVTAEPRSGPLLLPSCVLDERSIEVVRQADRQSLRAYNDRLASTHAYYYGTQSAV